MYLGMSESEANSVGWRGTNEGSKLAGRADLWDDGALENNAEFDISGFSFFPGGYRYHLTGTFSTLGGNGFLWSSTEDSSTNAWNRNVRYHLTTVNRTNTDKRVGFSVRCIKVVE